MNGVTGEEDVLSFRTHIEQNKGKDIVIGVTDWATQKDKHMLQRAHSIYYVGGECGN
jgi:hypothetical protein